MELIVTTPSVVVCTKNDSPEKIWPVKWSVGSGTDIVNNSSPMLWVSITLWSDWSSHVGFWKQPPENYSAKQKLSTATATTVSLAITATCITRKMRFYKCHDTFL